VTAATRLSYLRVALILVGLIFIFGVYPLMMALWPSGWRWSPNQAQYEQMILGVYATLGVFLLIASRNPLRHLSLIWFTVFSSIVHAGIMTVQALRMPSLSMATCLEMYRLCLYWAWFGLHRHPEGHSAIMRG
jgi:hypothetical protein